MNLAEQLLQITYGKNLTSNVLEQIQNCHSSVEDLLLNLQSVRALPKMQTVIQKIERVNIFMQVKRDVIQILQNDQNSVVTQWLLETLQMYPLLFEIVRKEDISIKKMIYLIVKKCFLSQQSLQDHLKENQTAKSYLFMLTAIKQQIQTDKVPSRDKLRIIDEHQNYLEDKINNFMQKIDMFNFQMLKLVQKIHQFQEVVSKSFNSFFSQSQKQREKSLNKSRKNQSSTDFRQNSTPRKRLSQNFSKTNPFPNNSFAMSRPNQTSDNFKNYPESDYSDFLELQSKLVPNHTSKLNYQIGSQVPTNDLFWRQPSINALKQARTHYLMR